MTRSVGMILLALLAIVMGAYGYQQSTIVNDEIDLKNAAVAAKATAETALKTARDQISQLQTAKDTAEAALKAARDQIGQLQGAKDASETALKAVRDQMVQLQSAMQAAEKALADAKKVQ